MKVLHFVSDVSLKNGIVDLIMNYYREIYKISGDKIIFDFVYFEKDADRFYEKEISSYGGSTYIMTKPTNILKFSKEWQTFCKEKFGRYDILHIHLPFLNFLFKNAKKDLGVKKIISHSHTSKFGETKHSEIRNSISYYFGRNVPDYYFACSQLAGNKIFGKRFETTGRVINNAINIQKYRFNPAIRRKIRDYYGLSNKFVIGHIGRFSEQKNHDFLVDVFFDYQNEHPNSVLVLIGEGKLEKKIREKVVALGIKNKVLFFGRKDNVNEILQAFDFFVFPSIFEGLGIALIEAETNGIPCLISDNVPKEANILESTKAISLNKSAEQWAKMITREKRDLNSLSASCKFGFDIHQEAKKLIDVYENIVY